MGWLSGFASDVSAVMLTDRQREKYKRNAQALDAGDQHLWLAAGPALSREQRREVWDQRAEVRALAERRKAEAALASHGDSPD